MLIVNITDVALITVKNVGYCYIIHSIIRPEAIDLLKSSVLEDCGYIRKYCLEFQFIQDSFSYFFCFATYKMVDIGYSTNIYKSLNISIGTVMKNPEMLKTCS